MQAPVPETSLFEKAWIERQMDFLLMRYGPNLDVENMKEQLHQAFHRHVYNPKVNLVNNHSGQLAKTSMIDIFDYIQRTKPILGGNGCLFMQHQAKDNPLLTWIRTRLSNRKMYKKKMFEVGIGTPLSDSYNLLQMNEKVKINSLYGVLGYVRFILHNMYLAQAVTLTGQHEISTAALCFEAFIADHWDLLDEESVWQFLAEAVRDTTKEKIYPFLVDDKVVQPTREELYAKIMRHVVFKVKPSFEEDLHAVISNMDDLAVRLAFYRNDVRALLRSPYLKALMRDYIRLMRSHVKDKNGNDTIVYTLTAAEPSWMTEDEQARDNELWSYIEALVLDLRPYYDRVRKTKYQYKNAVAYIDTDSNFLCLQRWVEFIQREILNPGEYPTEGDRKDDFDFTIANTFAIWLTRMSNATFDMMGRWMNIDAEHRSVFSMKNEVYYSRIIFVDAKKQYMGLKILQEGNRVPPKKQADIKGFVLKKSITKPFVRDFYTKLSLDKLLRVDEIKPVEVLREIMAFEASMRDAILHGDNQFFRQANVKTEAAYSNPYSNQGVRAVLLWNTLCPDYQLQLPTDVDIVPMRWDVGRKVHANPSRLQPWYIYAGRKVTRDKKTGQSYEVPIYADNETPTLRQLRDRYPEVYEVLDREIFHNSNPEIATMGIAYIAKPKNPDIPVPQWLYDFMDVDKILNSTLTLYNQVLSSIGIFIAQTSTTDSHYTNMVAL